jgi:hypothetical protein
MEKIQIQFNESDFKVYYDYCLRYYQIQDTVRKQSIQVFLDLFEKDIITVEERDITQARQFLSEKCDSLKRTRDGTVGEEETTVLFQERMCSDLLLLSEDLAKIFRLIEKHGVTANYLMILATFSRVIDENRNSHIAAMYDLKNEVVEALARPLAEIIRPRLGLDQHWDPVLRELTVIAARYNQRHDEPKFDLDIIQLVGPTVVSHFDSDAQPREILSVLPSYFEESELEEFEAVLNRGSEDVPDAGINWDAVHVPLNVVAKAVAAQRDKWAAQGRSDISGQYSLPPSMGTQPAGDGSYSVGAYSAGTPPVSGHKIFEIAVSPDFTTQVESPVKVYTIPESVPEPVKSSRIKPYIPVIIGGLVIVLFIIGTLIVSGGLNFGGAGHAANSSSAVGKNATVAKSTPAKTATTAKPTPTPVPTPTVAVYSSTDIGNHLVDIAFGLNNNGIQKLNGNAVPVSVSGFYTNDDTALLDNFTNQFNIYSETTQLAQNVSFDTGSGGIRLDFIPQSALLQMPIDKTTVYYKNDSNGDYYFLQTSQNEITSKNAVKTYIDSDLTGNDRERWTLRALLFNLGFFGTTTKYPNSLFYAGSTNATQPSSIDWDAIQLMYSNKITNGMSKGTVRGVI